MHSARAVGANGAGTESDRRENERENGAHEGSQRRVREADDSLNAGEPSSKRAKEDPEKKRNVSPPNCGISRP